MYYRWEQEIIEFPEDLEIHKSREYTQGSETYRYMSINLVNGLTAYYRDKADFRHDFDRLMKDYKYSELAFYKYNFKENVFEPLTGYDLIIVHDF